MPGKEQPSVKTSLIDDTVDSFFKNLGESNCVRQVYEGEIWIGTEINIKGNKINLEDVAGPLRIRRIEVCTKGLMFTVEVFDSNIKARSFLNQNRGAAMPVGGKPFTPKEEFECGSFIKLNYQDSEDYFKESLFPWLEECIERGKLTPALPTVMV